MKIMCQNTPTPFLSAAYFCNPQAPVCEMSVGDHLEWSRHRIGRRGAVACDLISTRLHPWWHILVQTRHETEDWLLLLSLCPHKTAWLSILFQYLNSQPEILFDQAYLYLSCHMIINHSQKARELSLWVASAAHPLMERAGTNTRPA